VFIRNWPALCRGKTSIYDPDYDPEKLAFLIRQQMTGGEMVNAEQKVNAEEKPSP